MANKWGNNGNSDRLYFLGSKITADGNCSHEIKRLLILGRKVMTNLDSILKSRQFFSNKGPSSQSYGFSSSAPAPSILYPSSNLDWRFVSYMILYMFQCHSFTNQWSWSICVWSRRQNSPHVPAERDAEGPSGWWTTHSKERRLERPQDHGREAAPQSLWKT